MSEPVRHHYIPQFILKNFCENNSLNFWNHKNRKFEKRNTKSVFMVKNLYRDINNHPEDIMIIEKKFSQLENDVANLIQEKIIDKKEIRINRIENEMLRKFLFLLSFRSENRKSQYIEKKFDPATLESLKPLVSNEDYVDLWFREINYILDLKSIKDCKPNKDLSWPISMDLKSSLRDYYMTFCEVRGQEFLLTDIYPTCEIFPIDIVSGAQLYLHEFFPLSPKIVLILNHVMFRKDRSVNGTPLEIIRKFSKVSDDMISIPRNIYSKKGIFSDDDVYVYPVRRIYKNDVEYINRLQLNEVQNGFAFQSFEDIEFSIKHYNNIPKSETKNNFDDIFLEENINSLNLEE